MQAQSFVIQGGNAFEFTENGGAVDAHGFEAELRWVPDDNWNISATLALMDAEFGDSNIGKVDGLALQGSQRDGRYGVADARARTRLSAGVRCLGQDDLGKFGGSVGILC